MTTIENLYEQTMSYLERYAAEISKSDNNSTLLNKLQNEMAYYCNSKAKYERIEKIFDESMTEADQTKTKEEAEVLFLAYEKKVDAVVKKKEPASNPRLKQFRTMCKKYEGNNEDDDEIEVTQNTVSTIDPISKKRMEDPVKNIKCGHHYEKSVVLNLIAQNPKTRCPIMGCSAPFLSAQHLIPDDELKRFLANSIPTGNVNVSSECFSLNDTL